MKILAVDDEAMGLDALTSAIEKAEPEAEVFGFRSPKEALSFVRDNDIYAALLDIRMPVISGIELAKQIKLIRPEVHIIFATGFDSYMKDAFQLHASGYLLKPITEKKVRAEFENLESLRQSYAKEAVKSGKRIRFQCFGNFEAFIDEKPIKFKYDRTKEVLAYIVSRRGALCTNGEIISNLWEDDGNHDSYLRGIRKDLVDTFKDLKISDVINQQRGKIGIDTSKVACDYYAFIEGDVAAINSYEGEFMSQYSWGEITNAEIDFQRY